MVQIPLCQFNRALDCLAGVMDHGTPAEQIKAAALTIDTVLRLHRIIGYQAARTGQLARNEARCILVEEKTEKVRKSQSTGESRTPQKAEKSKKAEF